MKINCEICGKFVAELETGSKIRKGAVMICRECAEDYGIRTEKYDYERNKYQEDDAIRRLNEILWKGFGK